MISPHRPLFAAAAVLWLFSAGWWAGQVLGLLPPGGLLPAPALHVLLMSLGFAVADRPWQVVALFVAFGVFYAIDEAQSKAFITDLEPARRASAIGLYGLVTGLVYLPASLIAGALWSIAPSAVFLVASAICLAAIVVFSVLRPDRGDRQVA